MPKDMRGTLKPNLKKTSETQPSFKGLCNIDGKEYWISAWTNVSEDGGKYLSLSFEPKEEQQPGRAKQILESVRARKTEKDEDIPW